MTGRDAGSDFAATDRAMASRTVRATSAMPRAPLAPAGGQSAFITAELPITSADLGRARRYAATRSPRRRRDPAPLALRLFVWFLFFCFLAAAAGGAVLLYHPTWLSFLRASLGSSPAVAAWPRA